METDWRGVAKAAPDALSLWFESPEPEEPAGAEERLAYAYRYIDLGWRLIPFNETKKLPLWALLPRNEAGRPVWTPLANRATKRTDVEGWLEREPQCGLALVTGSRSGGVVVVDFDTVPGSIPLTATARTARGAHLYFHNAEKLKSRKLADADLKAEGGLVGVPPNQHRTGVRYRWWPLLAPWECGVSPFSEIWLPQVAVENEPRGIARNTIARREVVETEPGGRLLALSCNEEVALIVARWMGWKVSRIGEAFLCPLHPDTHPSAALWHMPGMPVQLHCFHKQEFWLLTEVFASRYTRTLQTLGDGERAAWWARAMVECGVLKRPYIDAPRLPSRARPAVKKLYEGFCYLLAVRLHYDGGQTQAPYSWRFASGWSGVRCQNSIRDALQWLREEGYLVLDSRPGQMSVFSLGDGVKR